jgi:hypothetical protein
LRRAAEPAEIRADDQVSSGDRRPLRLPHPAVADACVEEDDGGSLPGNLAGESHDGENTSVRSR